MVEESSVQNLSTDAVPDVGYNYVKESFRYLRPSKISDNFAKEQLSY